MKYLLRRKKTTNEIHIFATNSPSLCDAVLMSQCNKISRDETENVHSFCASDSETRMQSANIGRPVCGQCVATLYTDY